MSRNFLDLRILLFIGIPFFANSLCENAYSQAIPTEPTNLARTNESVEPRESLFNIAPQHQLPEVSSTPTAEEQREIAEIRAIRERLGGSVVSPQWNQFGLEHRIGGDSPQSPAEDLERQFQQDLSALVIRGQASTGGQKASFGDGAIDRIREKELSAREEILSREREKLRYQDQLMGNAVPPSGSHFGLPQVIHNPRKSSELRSAARELEQSAARFEEVGLHADADRLRELARSFWERARP